MNVKKFKVAGVTHYEANIKQLVVENDDYRLPNSELKEICYGGEIIRQYECSARTVNLIPEPENVYDKNAVRVEIDGLQVGYIKKGSCSQVKNLLNSPDFAGVRIADIGIGKYKRIWEDDNGKLHVDSGKYDSCWAHIEILTHSHEPAVAPTKRSQPQRSYEANNARVSNVQVPDLQPLQNSATEGKKSQMHILFFVLAGLLLLASTTLPGLIILSAICLWRGIKLVKDTKNKNV